MPQNNNFNKNSLYSIIIKPNKSFMKRKHFLQHSLLAGGSLLTAGLNATPLGKQMENNTDKPFNLNYGFHDGMFANHAGKDFLDQIRFAYDKGFRSIEDNGMMGRSADMQSKIGDLLAKLGMTMGVFVLGFDNWPPHTTLTSGSKEWNEKFLNACNKSVDVAKRCNAKWITLVPGNFTRDISMGLQTANVIVALRKGCAIIEPHNLIFVLEPLSDTPDLFLRNSDQTYAICKAIDSASCKILFDMYHMQRNEGNIINNIDSYYDEIAYFQIGDNPNRNEPYTGEMNYHNIFKHIHQKGYKGVMGMEHGLSEKGKEGELTLIKAYRDADNFR